MSRLTAEPWQSCPCHTRPRSLKKKICLAQLLYGFETQIFDLMGHPLHLDITPDAAQTWQTQQMRACCSSLSPEVLFTVSPHPREGSFHSQGSTLIVSTTYRRACYSLLSARAGKLRQNNSLTSTKDNISQFMPKTLCNLRQASEDAIVVILLLIC